MKNIIPEKLNDFRIYINGSTDLKGTADLQLPSFESMTETVSGAGIAGEYESPNIGHFSSMKFTINWKMITGELTEFLKPEVMMIDCRLANQEYNAVQGKHEFKANRVVVKGIPTTNDLGKAEKGSTYDGSSEIEVLYIKVQRDGKTLVELDKINYIYIVDGVDYMVKLRTALGM
ncbi:Phage tail tube protein FII-like protein [Desulfitobacterium hafniense]|uniref:Phage tail tube protein FII-like protein n=1 Tax=Desulfitobacterium hafniense TaxID=49338 RepID=A0A098AYV2_DESHA|nr:phage major tail tube protein [Desulfitobacterium hafniense]CDX01300.1 Phage tail tube protein FII-like protein [Desulfitobacterium hafniense]